ncbi:hypothetical protein QUF70_09300 [Desulfobacterales bacterium HSG17]|nr:hypothetical protein [Desulfobacterales bacterium HSG17]
MKNFAILLLIVVLAGGVFGALNYHFIRTNDGLSVLKKTELTIEDTYVDARGIKKIKLLTNPSLVKAGIKDILK